MDYFFLALLLAQHVLGEQNLYVSVVKGIFANKLPNIRVYEASVPIHFLVKLPEITGHLDIPDKCLDAEHVCYILKKSEDLLKTTMDDIITSHPYLRNFVASNNTQRTERGLIDIVGYSSKYLFGMATMSDVDKLHVGVNFMRQKQKEMELGIAEQQRALSSTVANITTYTAKLEKVLNNNFKQLKEGILETADTSNKNEAILAHVSFNGLYLQWMLHTVETVNSIAADCRNKLIPRAVISTAILEKRLKDLSFELGKNQWELVADVNGLWKAPITSCLFSNHELQLSIHVPIRRKTHIYEVFELVGVPFQFHDQQCIISDFTHYIAKGKRTVVPITSTMSAFCKPAEHPFCLISQYDKDSSPFAHCATSIFEGNVDDITSTCTFKCWTSNHTRITELYEGTVAVTNAQYLELICDDQDEVVKYNIDDKIGAILIRMSCKCKVLINGDRTNILHPPFPCSIKNSDVATVTQIIPTHMSKMRGILQLDNGLTPHKNLSDVLDYQWPERVPVLNISTPTPYKFSSAYAFEDFMKQSYQSSSTVYLWLMALTIAILLLSFIVCVPMLKRGNTMSVGTSSLAMLMYLPCVLADDATTNIGKAIMLLFNAIEIMNVIVLLAGLSFGISMVIIIIKIHRIVKQTHNICKTLSMDSEIQERRRNYP